MKRKFGVLFLALAASLMVCSTSMAQNRADAWSVTPFVGGYHFNSDTHLTKSVVGGVRIGYNLTESWTLEGLASLAANNRSERNYPNYRGGQTYADSKIIGYRGEVLYNFMPGKRFVPFIAAGIGGRKVSFDNTGNNDGAMTHLVLDYGVGCKLFFAEDWALRADVRHLFLPNDRLHNLEYTVGISYFFGGKKKAVAEATPAPAPAPAPAPGPAPAPAPKPKAAPDQKVTIAMNILFDFDKADIKPQYHNELKKVSDYMNAYPWENATLEGHTCNIGTDAYNKGLSQRRVDSVKKYLVEKLGISADRLTAVGYGSSNPIASNDTREGRQQNRRVQAVMETYIKGN